MKSLKLYWYEYPEMDPLIVDIERVNNFFDLKKVVAKSFDISPSQINLWFCRPNSKPQPVQNFYLSIKMGSMLQNQIFFSAPFQFQPKKEKQHESKKEMDDPKKVIKQTKDEDKKIDVKSSVDSKHQNDNKTEKEIKTEKDGKERKERKEEDKLDLDQELLNFFEVSFSKIAKKMDRTGKEKKTEEIKAETNFEKKLKEMVDLFI